MDLLQLPVDLLCHVAECVASDRDLASFTQSSKLMHEITTRFLYRRKKEGHYYAVYWAVHANALATLKRAAEVGIPLQSQIHDYLHSAARLGHVQVTEYLLDTGLYDIDCWNDQGNTALIEAIEFRHMDIVQLLLSRGADPSYPSYSQAPTPPTLFPFHIAIQIGDEDIAKLLLSVGASIDVVGENGETAVLLAIRLHMSELAHLLLDLGADVNHRDDEGSGSVWIATTHGHADLVDRSLSLGASVRADEAAELLAIVIDDEAMFRFASVFIDMGADVNEPSLDNNPLIIYAAQCGLVDATRLLIKAGTRLDFGDLANKTALHIAVEEGHYEVAEVLIEAGADVVPVDVNGRQPLDYASTPEMVALLLDGGVDVLAINDGTRRSPLSWAVSQGYTRVARLFLERGADMQDKIDGYSLLYVACLNEHVGLVRLLLEYGAHQQAGGAELWAPIHAAASKDCVQTLQELSKHCIDINLTTSDGSTPLAIAVEQERIQIVKYLLQQGADINMSRHHDGHTPLFISIYWRYEQIAEILCTNGANINTCSKMGQTAVCMASFFGLERTIEIMLSTKTFNIDHQDLYGRTILHLASMRGHVSVVELLLSQDPPPNHMLEDRWGATPLILAVRNGQCEIAEKLLELGHKSLYQKDSLDLNVFDWAARCGDSAMRRLLSITPEGNGIDITDIAWMAPHEDAEFKYDSCFCDVCGRCTACKASVRGADKCHDCQGNTGENLVICLFCLRSGVTCLDSEHKRDEFVCSCDVSEYFGYWH